jgi:hypothetical protein
MAREWYRFFLNLFVLTGSGNNPITLEELQLGPPNQPDLAELLIQINQNIAPQYEDQSGDFLATLDTAQLMSMMSRFENAEAAIQGAYLQPVVQTGTIANYNLDGSPTAGGIAYGTGPALAVSAAGTLGQVLTSAGAGTPTWAAAATGTVTSVSVVSANGLAGTVATATTTPAITLSTTVTGLLKGNGTAISAATSGTDYAPATSGTSILYGNGSGGFSNVTIGTGVAFTAGTLSATGSGGTVTSVTGTAPVVSSGGATPDISMAAATTSINGYLTSTDWNTFNNKGSGSVTSVSGTGTVNGITLTGTVTSSGSLTLGGTLSLASPPTIGNTAPNTGAFTTLSATGTLSGGTSGTGYSFSGSAPASSLALNASGDLGVGTASPTARLHVSGTGTIREKLASTTGAVELWLVSDSQSNASYSNIYCGDGTNFNWAIGGSSGTTNTMTFATGGTERARFNSTGAFVFAGGTTTANGIGITFPATQSASTNANTLDDYEEGTWTPNLYSAGGGNPTFTSSGVYTKIGRQVTAIGKITLTSTAGLVGYYIDGLPFAAAATSQTSATGVETAANSGALAILFANTTTLLLQRYDGVFIGVTGLVFQINATYIV